MKFTYEPIIKGKNFCPNPVARYGIPEFADSDRFPSVEGTYAHEQWWLEQFDRCINGYWTGGIFIPGRFYYYLNFCRITTIKRGRHHPDFVDLDLEYFLLVEEAKLHNKGIISIKARRKGLSEKAVAIMDHGMRFTPEGYRAGICAGLQEYVDDFYAKITDANSDKAPELRLQFLGEDKELVAGWSEQSTSGWVKKGSKNTVFYKTMFNNENVFKGKLLWDCVFEEAGEFKRLMSGYGATKPCFAVGDEMKGTPFVYGTGGNIKTSSRDFKEMWDEAHHFHLLKFEVMAQRLMVGFFVGSKNAEEQVPDKCPNIFAKYKDLDYEQLLGCEDVVAGDDRLVEIRTDLLKAKNKKRYWSEVQENPRETREAFLKFTGNNFDAEIINEQLMKLDLLTTPDYSRYVLSWKKDADGKFRQPLQVEATPAGINVPDDMCVLIHKDGFPRRHYRNQIVHGIDSYDQDESITSKSLGGSMIMARKGNWIDPTKRIPLAIYYDRPKRKEMFWEISLMMSVFWDTIRNTMIVADNPAVFDFYKRWGCKRYLSPRPLSFESDNSEQKHEFGVLFTNGKQSKPQALSITQSWVVDEIDACVFPVVLKELTDYDIEQKDSDWDIVDALMCCLVRDVDMKRAPTQEDPEEEDPYDLGEWIEDADGNVINTSEYRPSNPRKRDPERESVLHQPDIFLQLLEQGKL